MFHFKTMLLGSILLLEHMLSISNYFLSLFFSSKRQRKSVTERSNIVLKWNIKGNLKKRGPPQRLPSRNLNSYKMKSVKCSISILRFSFCNLSSSLMLAPEVALASSSRLWCFISKRCCSARYCFWNTCWVFLIIFCLFFSVPRGREKALPSGATSFWNETSKATWRSEGHLSGCHQGTWTATKWKA